MITAQTIRYKLTSKYALQEILIAMDEEIIRKVDAISGLQPPLNKGDSLYCNISIDIENYMLWYVDDIVASYEQRGFIAAVKKGGGTKFGYFELSVKIN